MNFSIQNSPFPAFPQLGNGHRQSGGTLFFGGSVSQEEIHQKIRDFFNQYNARQNGELPILKWQAYFLNDQINNHFFKQAILKKGKFDEGDLLEIRNKLVPMLLEPSKSDRTSDRTKVSLKELQALYRYYVGHQENGTYHPDSIFNWVFNRILDNKNVLNQLSSRLQSKIYEDPSPVGRRQNSFDLTAYPRDNQGSNADPGEMREVGGTAPPGSVHSFKVSPVPRVVKKDRVSERQHYQLLNAASQRLKDKVISQDSAIDALIDEFAVHYCNQTDERHAEKPSQPWVRTLIYGPSGVGKTTVGLQLAEALGRPCLRYDMNAYKTEESVRRFTGAESGIKGFMSGCSIPEQIEKAIRENKRPPIVIFDEFEKGHPDIQHMIMGLLDYGKMPKADLTELDAKGIDILLTTNAGIKTITQKFAEGQRGKSLSDSAYQAMAAVFPPEVLGRIGKTIFFKPLDKQDAEKVMDKHTAELRRNLLQERNVDIHFEDAAKRQLLNASFVGQTGVRGLGNILQDAIKIPLMKQLMAENPSEYFNRSGIKVRVGYDAAAQMYTFTPVR